MANSPLQSNGDFSLPYHSSIHNKYQISELLAKVVAAEKAIAEVKLAFQQQGEEYQTCSNDTKEIRSGPDVLRRHTENEDYGDFAQVQGNLVEAGPFEITEQNTPTHRHLEEEPQADAHRAFPRLHDIGLGSHGAVGNPIDDHWTDTIWYGSADLGQSGLVAASVLPSDDLVAPQPMTIDPQLIALTNYYPPATIPTTLTNLPANTTTSTITRLPCPGCAKPQCTKTFKRKHDLQRHLNRGHFECPEPSCDRKGARAFPRKDKLRDHQRKIHNLGGDAVQVE